MPQVVTTIICLGLFSACSLFSKVDVASCPPLGFEIPSFKKKIRDLLEPFSYNIWVGSNVEGSGNQTSHYTGPLLLPTVSRQHESVNLEVA